VIACQCEVCVSSDVRDQRLRTSILISHKGRNISIDSGPDFRQQMLRERVTSLDGIVFTHEHKDHIAGLDDVRAFNYMTGEKMDVYCTKRVELALMREFGYAFDEGSYPGVPRLRVVPIQQDPFSAAGLVFQPIEVMHMKMPVMGYRVGNFAYITDANFISGKEKEKLKGLDHLVLNALRREKHPSHFNLDEAIDLVRELNPGKAYFTHISHQLGRHEDVESALPDNIRLAYDGLKIAC